MMSRPRAPPAPASPAGEDARTVLLPAFTDVEVLDFAGPYEVFNVAGELAEAGSAPLRVRSVGLQPGPVVGRGGFTVVPDLTLAEAVREHPRPAVVIIPGGAGARRLLEDAEVLAWVRSAAAGGGILASVCTGALVLAAAGALAGGQATTHHGAFEELHRLSLTTRVRRGERFVSVDDTSQGRVWTSGVVLYPPTDLPQAYQLGKEGVLVSPRL